MATRQLRKKLAKWETFGTGKKPNIKGRKILAVPTDKYGTILRTR